LPKLNVISLTVTSIVFIKLIFSHPTPPFPQ
jgi:hypothetical protein